MSESLSGKSVIDRKTSEQNQRQIVWWQPPHVLFREAFTRDAGCRESEISNNRTRRGFVCRDVCHPDRTPLLIRPGMSLQIVIEPFVATIEELKFVLLFQASDQNSHSASQRLDQGFGRFSTFGRDKCSQFVQFLLRPSDLHPGKHKFRSYALKTRQHKFLPPTTFALAKYATATLPFPHGPPEQCQGFTKKIGIAAKLQFLLKAANDSVFSRSQISLKLRLAHHPLGAVRLAGSLPYGRHRSIPLVSL